MPEPREVPGEQEGRDHDREDIGAPPPPEETAQAGERLPPQEPAEASEHQPERQPEEAAEVCQHQQQPVTATRVVTLTPAFKMVFISVVALTVLTLILAAILTIWGHEDENVKDLVKSCTTAFQMGFGAVVGMLSGKLLG